jgi:stage V sporulation protein D (sporulation-specific penicillin-binding protein)
VLGRTDRRLRHLGLLVLFGGMALALSARLVYWQVGMAGDLRQRAEERLDRPSLVFAQRGDITDRRGTLLATTAYRDLLAAYPDTLAEDAREPMARRLGELLGFDGQHIAQLVERFRDGVPYTIVSRRLTAEQSQQVRAGMAAGELAALSLEPHPVRFYPNPGGVPRTTLASQLLGFVTEDGEGRYGVEQYSHALLSGVSPSTASLDGAPAAGGNGASVQLTIDASLQLRVEKELYAVWVADKARRVSAVVMDPYSGDILAWASVPGYDANSYGLTASESPGLFVDPLASEVYEPGSVMKMVTAAAALEAGVVTPSSVIQDDAALRFGPYEVRNSDQRGMGPLTLREVLAYSRNVATGKIAARLGETTDEAAGVLYDMWQRLGLGARSGVEVGNEVAGLVADPAEDDWTAIDLANRSFGQGVAVTQVQLAAAYSAFVNGGELVRPRLLAAVGGEPIARSEPTQALDPAVAGSVRSLLESNLTIVPRVHNRTAIEGYVVGGKTGTAQYWDSRRNAWAEDRYNYTFCGFVGGDRPELVIVVRIHEAQPTVRRHGLLIPEVESYDVFRRVAQNAIDVLDIAPKSNGRTPGAPTLPPIPSSDEWR